MGDATATTPTGWDHSEEPPPDSPVLGVLALVFAVPSVLLAITYFLSPLALLGSTIATPLGILARRDARSRELGTAALVVAAVACAIAIYTLLSFG
jgi:hypothetical protein